MFFKPKQEMVKYWKSSDGVMAKVTEAKDGSYVMHLDGEKYPFPGFPRGRLLYGTLSPLKHQIKNKIFNESWALLEEGKSDEEVKAHIRQKTDEIMELAESVRYEMLPIEKCAPAIREIWRALSAVEGDSKRTKAMKEILCFILQEDDGYRFRFQWIAKFVPRWKRNPIRDFTKGMEMLEHAEVIGDMKERVRLVRRILLFILHDEEMGKIFRDFLQETDWRKIGLSKEDKYYFRAKYFKVDYPEYEY